MKAESFQTESQEYKTGADFQCLKNHSVSGSTQCHFSNCMRSHFRGGTPLYGNTGSSSVEIKTAIKSIYDTII
jgi:hypothetical protein